MALPERITKRIEIQVNGCWTWKGAMNGPHGIAAMGGRSQPVRRLVYEDRYGQASGKLLQRCASPSCVNPEHMFPSTHRGRFWDHVDKNGPVHPIHGQCWIWTGGRSAGGYGAFRDSGVQRGAHQVALEMATGRAISEGAVIMHKCDRRACVRACHLEEGTQRDNIHDAMKKGRRAVGARHPSARLVDEDVRAIRTDYAQGATQASLAARYNINQTAVSAIIRGVSWKHLH